MICQKCNDDHSKVLKRNTGLRSERVNSPYGDLEKSFQVNWDSENRDRPGVNKGRGILQDLFIEPKKVADEFKGPDKDYDSKLHPECSVFVYKIKEREYRIVATIIQWLGTNCGFSFLTKCLEKANFKIIEKKLFDEIWESHYTLNKILNRENLPLLLGITPEIDDVVSKRFKK